MLIGKQPNQIKEVVKLERIGIIDLGSNSARLVVVELLGDGTQLKISQSYEIARDEHRLYIFLPEICPDADDTVVAVKLDGKAEVQTI